jgi:hypothetical protein
MRRFCSAFLALALCLSALLPPAAVTPAVAAATPAVQVGSRDTVLAWINAYDPQKDFARAPSVMKQASDFGAMTDPESAGMYVGFMAGLIAVRPKEAGKTIDGFLSMRSADHWSIVRAIAYSGHPDWRGLMERYRKKMPTRDLMAQRFLEGKLPTFDTPEPEKKKWTQRANPVNWFKKKEDEDVTPLNERADIVDVHWGMYFAMRSEAPLKRMVDLLPWAENRDSFEKLTIGSMVKYTMAMNASRDSKLLARLKTIKTQTTNKDAAKHLGEAIEAAETVEIALLRRDALARMEELKRMGPGYKRDVAWWGKVGQGALSLGCIGAAVSGMVGLGLPCVLGGAASSAALNFWSGS